MGELNWSDDRVEQLKSLWAEGLSASQVAQTLGGTSRNAVIGKIHRLGLAGRAGVSPVRRQRTSVRVKPVRVAAPRAITPVIALEALRLDDGAFATARTISNQMCHWPIGDAKASDFHFCGRAPKTGAPYCDVHDRQAHRPHKARVPKAVKQCGRRSRREDGMILIPDETRPLLLANGKHPEHDHVPLIKLFDPVGVATWLISEINPYDQDILFGLADLGFGCPELGTVSLTELESLRRPYGLRIERDIAFVGHHPLSVYADAAVRLGAITTVSALLAQAAARLKE